MSFETGIPDQYFAPAPPDFSGGIAEYTREVESISVTLRAKQEELLAVQKQINDAKALLQLQYQTTKIDPLETRVQNLQAQIDTLVAEHSQWVIKAEDRRKQFEGISLDFSSKQKALDDSWADFHVQAAQLMVDLKRLNSDEGALEINKANFAKDKVTWQDLKTSEQAVIEGMKKDTSTLLAQATQIKSDADNKMAVSVVAVQDVEVQKADFLAKINAAQPLLDLADAISKQKTQNEADAKVNADAALQNQNDANQIKVAKIVLNNQQQDYNSRMQTLLAAEAALKTGA